MMLFTMDFIELAYFAKPANTIGVVFASDQTERPPTAKKS